VLLLNLGSKVLPVIFQQIVFPTVIPLNLVTALLPINALVHVIFTLRQLGLFKLRMIIPDEICNGCSTSGAC
jgi:hypothetical protein